VITARNEVVGTVGDLLTELRTTSSFVTTFARHLGVETLELDRVTANTGHRLTERERAVLEPHPGTLFGYRRSACLRTPRPVSRVVAWVEVTALLGRVPRSAAEDVLRANRTLGSILTELGATREFVDVRVGGRYDAAGEPIAFRLEAVLKLLGQPVALVREDVYQDVVSGLRPRSDARG
jgi:hypothetical protein